MKRVVVTTVDFCHDGVHNTKVVGFYIDMNDGILDGIKYAIDTAHDKYESGLMVWDFIPDKTGYERNEYSCHFWKPHDPDYDVTVTVSVETKNVFEHVSVC